MARLASAGRSAASGRSAVSRYNLRIAVGTYTGNGTSQTITTGHTPNLIIVQGPGTVATHSTRAMGAAAAFSLGSNTGVSATTILGRVPTGFIVGSNSTVNTNATSYFYLTVTGNTAQNYFRAVAYTGTGGDNRQLTNAGLFLRPDIFWTRGGTNNTSGRISAQVGDDSLHFVSIDNAANEIQAFVSNGLELGTSALVNASGTTYYGTGFVNYSGVIANGQYTGDGTDNRVITTGINTADLIVVKAATGTLSGVIKISTMATDTSYLMTSGGSSNIRIKNPTSTGFTVGTSTNVNGNGTVYNWFALKAGNFYLPVPRTSV